VADPDQAFGEQSNWGVPRRSKYQKLSATIVVCHTKEVTFCRSKSGYFCWSNYAIFQGKTTVWKRFISSIQKRFETGPKQWASFFTSYTDLVYLQNVFKRFKSMLRASICHCFGYVQRNQQACPWEWDSYGNPMVNVPWDGMRRDRHKLLWDGNGTDECVPWKTLGLSMGMSFLWESHAKRSMGWDRHKLLWDWDGTDKYVSWTTLEISEEQCLKRIPDLVRSRMVLLRLGSDNSCPTIGLKWKVKWRSRFQAKLVHLHVHERLIHCWSDNSNTTPE